MIYLIRPALCFAVLLLFLTASMPETWLGRSSNLFGTMLCAMVFGAELRVVCDRLRRRKRP